MRKIARRRVGRPVGPTSGKGSRHRGPARLDPIECIALQLVHHHRGIPLQLLAARFEMNLSELSKLVSSPLGRDYLETLKAIDRNEPALLPAPDFLEIRPCSTEEFLIRYGYIPSKVN
jgi:hypothetical protein